MCDGFTITTLDGLFKVSFKVTYCRFTSKERRKIPANSSFRAEEIPDVLSEKQHEPRNRRHTRGELSQQCDYYCYTSERSHKSSQLLTFTLWENNTGTIEWPQLKMEKQCCERIEHLDCRIIFCIYCFQCHLNLRCLVSFCPESYISLKKEKYNDSFNVVTEQWLCVVSCCVQYA